MFAFDPNRAESGAEYRALRRVLRANKRNGKPRLTAQPKRRSVGARRRIASGNR